MKTIRNFSSDMFPRYLWLIALVLAVTIFMIGRADIPVSAQAASSQIVISPSSTVPMLVGTVQPINNTFGNQTSPHVDCGMMSYTNDDLEGSSTIRYYNFSTGLEMTAPGNTLDLLSDILGYRVMFTEVTAGGNQIVVFDTISHTRTVISGSTDGFSPSAGGDIIAFEGRSTPTNSLDNTEISVYDAGTNSVIRLTNDDLPDQFPNTNTSGNAVVWQKCQPDGRNCDIYSSVRTSPGVYTTRVLTDATGNDQFPHTDGRIVVYTSDRTGENDIYFQPVEGGTETRISIPGDQRWPTISGDLISFESETAPSDYDLYVYDIRSGTLYQVTNTPGYNETLSDISVCGSTGRIVYAMPGGGAFDVYALTFQPPDPPKGRITDLISVVRGFGLPKGTETSLVIKLQDAVAALNGGNSATACDALGDFISEVNAQSGKKLTVQQAQQLIDSATSIKGLVGCG